MRRVDEIMAQRLCHILTEVEELRGYQVIVLSHEKLEETFLGEMTCRKQQQHAS